MDKYTNKDFNAYGQNVSWDERWNNPLSKVYIIAELNGELYFILSPKVM